ncbi:MAG: thiosulfate oxidation carrier complex protein SoxZ [Gammaproteobacteria bacterium]|nr:thiosulfate oxidation carrier complex protein SoxZ [Gammaproteobacteria bacterium]MDH5692810.1 thiosulfate oxidation carrier complex protein SoxZ [Gammaproteobacteria bacterium]
MASNTVKIKAKAAGGRIEVKTLIKHVMETGLRKDKKTGEKIPAHFIKEVSCEHNGKPVMVANWGVAISKNPYLSFNILGGTKGDTIKISWVDNKGESDSAVEKVK